MKYLFLFLLASCSKPAPQPPAKNPELLLLVAPWCEPCKKELEYLKTHPTKVKVSIVCETGEKSFDPPSIESCNALGGVPDTKAWALFKKYVGANTKYLPVAIVLDGETVVRKYAPPYEIEEVISYVEGLK